MTPTPEHASENPYTPVAGTPVRTTGRGAVRSFHWLSARFTAGRAKAHKHATHKSAISQIEGRSVIFWGDCLQHRMEASPGHLIYIPAEMPHLPVNPGPYTAVNARTDQNEQESVVLLPEQEGLMAG